MARPLPIPLNFGEPRKRVNLPLSLDSNFRKNERNDMDIKFNEIMNRTGKITVGGREYKAVIDDLEDLGPLGSGSCGQVVKMKHKATDEIIAVKQMRRSGNADENKRIIMDLEVVLKSNDCPFIVKCLGCIITDSEVWICMELMASCMDKLLKTLRAPLPEQILGKVAVATVKALHYLKETHGVIHRDIKPSNILLDEKGNFKLCDFGISGQLVDSKAKTRNAGCAAYMAPERINPEDPKKPTYDIRADVWSLGITCVELGTGRFPYSDCKTDFEVMAKILEVDPPSLPDTANFSREFRDFVKRCLAKSYKHRPKYKELLEHEFIKIHETKQVDVATWYKIYCAPTPRQSQHHSLGFNNIGRHSGGRSRVVNSAGNSGRLGQAGSPRSPITPSPGGRSRQEDWLLQSPRGIRSTFDRLNSDPSPSARTPSTPGTPSPLQGNAPDPPPRLSRMSSEGLRTPTPTSSSGIGSSSSGSGLLMSPSPTSLSMANSTPSPPDGDHLPQPPMRRMCLCYFLRIRRLPVVLSAKHYKIGLEILSCLVIFIQLARIAIIGYEIKNISNEFARETFSDNNELVDRKSSYLSFPKSDAIFFCIMSIILGALSCFIFEPLLLWSLKKRHLPGIQPWFVSTMLIFLIAGVCSVVTFSIYVIKPIDHNYRLKLKAESSFSKLRNETGTTAGPEISTMTFNVSNSSNLTLRVAEINGIVACVRIRSESLQSGGGQNITAREGIVSGKGRDANHTLCKDKESSKPVLYYSNSVLAMSFFIDVIRCLPQLYLVNRFVKAEKLHDVHLASHQSLNALYIKQTI